MMLEVHFLYKNNSFVLSSSSIHSPNSSVQKFHTDERWLAAYSPSRGTSTLLKGQHEEGKFSAGECLVEKNKNKN